MDGWREGALVGRGRGYFSEAQEDGCERKGNDV